MPDSFRQRYEELQIEALLARYPRLRIVPSQDERFALKGTLDFHVIGPANEDIADSYEIELTIRPGFPKELPGVRETGGRIPKDYHNLRGGELCVGAPTEIRLRLREAPTLLTFVEGFVVPYLYGYSHREKHGTIPYGELAHGNDGIRQNLAAMFRAKSMEQSEEFLRLAGMKKRSANKLPCPCGSGRRLGRCHNRSVNQWRREIGRHWFSAEYERIAELLKVYGDAESPRRPLGRHRLTP
jgi:hypothetical protein